MKSLSRPVDILVNNAGNVLRAPAVTHSDDYWDQILEINLNAQFVLTRELAKNMLDKGSGKVIFIASLLSFQGGITVPGYAASKGGIAQLTKALANEWAGMGVNVNAIAPGYIATKIQKHFETIRNVKLQFSIEYPKVDGVGQKILKGQQCFWPVKLPVI